MSGSHQVATQQISPCSPKLTTTTITRITSSTSRLTSNSPLSSTMTTRGQNARKRYRESKVRQKHSHSQTHYLLLNYLYHNYDV